MEIFEQSPYLAILAILVASFFFDLIIGDPRITFHPVRLLGALINGVESLLKRLGLSGRVGGLLLALLVEVSALYVIVLVLFLSARLGRLVSLVVASLICFSCISLKDLVGHVRPVLASLQNGDLDQARSAVGMVVGRDANALDEKGVARAAIETLAENFVDGFFSPICWFAVGGLIGHLLGSDPVLTAVASMVAFKVASTLDSMVGYKDDAYKELGCPSARLDDVFNYIPARLSLLPLFFATPLCRLNACQGLRIFFRDRLKHDSPNAAHAESFVAGALGIRLGGALRYPHGVKEKPWLGQEFSDPEPRDIQKALCLVKAGAWITVLFASLLTLSLHIFS